MKVYEANVDYEAEMLFLDHRKGLMKCEVITLTRKNKNLPHSIRMYWTNFWQATVHVQKNIFEKTLIEVGSSHLYASFGTFWVQICQSIEAQWDFGRIRIRNRNRSHFPLKTAILLFSNIFQKLTVSPKIYLFGCKRCQKKRKDVTYQLP